MLAHGVRVFSSRSVGFITLGLLVRRIPCWEESVGGKVLTNFMEAEKQKQEGVDVRIYSSRVCFLCPDFLPLGPTPKMFLHTTILHWDGD